MPYLADLVEASERRLRSQLADGESVLAFGRCADISEGRRIESGGATWDVVMVTDRAICWGPARHPDRAAIVALGEVAAVSERTKAHRYAIALEHHELERRVQVPAHRFWRFAWGNAEGSRTFSRTELAFSRRETAAAIALREQLARRGLLP